MIKYLLMIALSTCMFACGEDQESAPEEETNETAETDEPESTVDGETDQETNEEVTAEQLPIAEDFEEEVATEITEENYLAALDELEGELPEE